MRNRPLVVGHRGWRNRYPENTLAGLQAALDVGCDALEFDLRLSRDGHVVVIHDETVDRTTDGQGCVHDLTLAELKRLDAGAWFGEQFAGRRIPTLEEALGLAPPGIVLYAEVKDGRPEMVEALLPQVEPRAHDVIVHSFDREFLAAVRSANASMHTGLLGHADKLDLLAEARRLGCQGIHPCVDGLTRAMVAAWQAEGFSIMVWTVRSVADIPRALALAADAVGADCPDEVLEALERAAFDG